MPYSIRPLRRDELAWAIECAAEEGWNPGLHDAATFHAADPDGFLVGELDGEKIGCISAVNHAGRFGFIGLYIVRPAWRGRGFGLPLWQAGLARLDGLPVGLDGVPAQQANYRRSGFALLWQNQRHAGVGRPLAAPPSPALVPLALVEFEALAAWDARTFPAPRPAFLRAWVEQPDATELAWREPDGRIAGWGLVRACRTGHKIGPLVAERPEVAAALFDALCARVPAGEPVFLDIPLPNAAARALVRERGLRPVFETARMVRGTPPVLPLALIYGITSFELG